MRIRDGNEPRLKQLVKELRRRWQATLWIGGGNAAIGEAWTAVGAYYIHVRWNFGSWVELDIRDQHSVVIADWCAEPGDDAYDVARQLIDVIPYRADDLEQIYGEVMRQLDNLKAA